MIKVYGDILSGNCYKIKLLLALLEQPHQWLHINILNSETHTPEFLHKNPNGKIPLIELDDGNVLFESNAIINYLAEGTAFLPQDALAKAKVLQWQFFEQYSHEPYIATARYIAKYLKMPESRTAEFYGKQAGGHKALSVMNQHLSQQDYFVENNYTIADISLYAYTHVADEGGFDLTPYTHILSWMNRIEAHPRHVTMQQFL